ncbi:response regulator [Magnetococcales bacterium HHB-1]
MLDAQLKVLVLTDSPTLDSIIKMALKGDEYSVEILSSGDENFFETLVASKPNLVFLRTELKNAQGLEICDRMKMHAELVNARIIFLSGNSRIRELAINHRADQFLKLPFTPADALKMVQKLFKSQPSILYVDDSDLFHEIVVPALKVEGFRVIQAWDGREALDLVDEHEFDLILSDVEMPEMDGVTLCRNIKKTTIRDIPFVLLTSLNSEEAIHKGFDAGADDYITKPIVLQELITRVKRLLTLDRVGFVRPEKILVVEDVVAIRSMIAKALQAQGFQVETAEHGIEAMAKLMAKRYHLLVTDYEMPHLDGLELCMRLRKQEKADEELPIIFATSRNSKADQVKMRSIGIKAYVAKPFSADRIVSEVERVLSETRTEQQRRRLRHYNLSESIVKKLENADADGEIDIAEDQFRTMVFIDVIGFSKLAEDYGASKTVMLLNRCFEHFSRHILKYDGTIDQFIGDGILASFGRQEDGAHRAVAAMDKIISTLDKLSKKIEKKVKIKIGIHSGYVVLGKIGCRSIRQEFALLGPNVSITQLMEKNAPENGILISEATHTMLKDQLAVQDAQTIEYTKGEPIQAFVVESVESYERC